MNLIKLTVLIVAALMLSAGARVDYVGLQREVAAVMACIGAYTEGTR